MSGGPELVLVNPGGRGEIYQALGESLAAVEPPVWAGLMASFARREGLRVAIVDADAEGLGPAQAAARVAEMRPLLAAVVVYGHQPSASTQVMPAAGAIVRALKAAAPTLPIALAGGHAAALPQRTLEEEAADFVCDGEGPVTLVELARALGSAHPDPAGVRGLWYRDAGATRRSAPAPLVDDLDRHMPAVAWDLLPMDRYRAHNWHCFGDLRRQPYAAIYTTLGCPYGCGFCCIQAPFRSGERLAGLRESVNSYRLWSARSVVAQIDELVERHGVRNLKIADEMFVLNPRHVHAVCDLLIERGHDLNIWAYARVDTVRPDMIDKLRRAGFRWLALGIEAASTRVRDDVDKGFDLDDAHRTVLALRQAGIHVIANYIFGLPEDDLETMQQTLGLALDLNTEFANFYCAMAYPGSDLYRLALAQGWPLPETWAGYSQHSVDTRPLPTKHLSAAEVLRFRDRAFRTYFTSPRYLEMIDRTFGPATVEHIRQMTWHTLERRCPE